MKNILILYTSVGLGHKVVAENIALALKARPQVKVTLLDILEFYKGPLIKASTRVYESILRMFPWLWRFFYTSKLFNRLTLPLRIPVAARKAKKFSTFLEQEKPDLVLTTQTTATAVMSYLKGKGIYQGLLVTSFSDYHFQPYWVYPHVDRYLVVTKEQAVEVIARGFSREQVRVIGLPIDESFKIRIKKTEIIKKFDLSRAKPIIVMMGGSRGWGLRIGDIQSVLQSVYDVQLVVIAGFNPKLMETLKPLTTKFPEQLRLIGHISSEEVSALFARARLLITKPGGLSVGQALLMSLPMILVNPLPGMEELNQKYLLERGVAVVAKTSDEARAWVERLLQDKKFYQEMRERMKRLSAPQAGKQAAQSIVDMLSSQY